MVRSMPSNDETYMVYDWFHDNICKNCRHTHVCLKRIEMLLVCSVRMFKTVRGLLNKKKETEGD